MAWADCRQELMLGGEGELADSGGTAMAVLKVKTGA